MAVKRAKKKSVSKVSQPVRSKSDDSKLFAFIATFFSIIGFVIVLIFKRENVYVMHYAKQSLVVFVVAVIASIIDVVVGWIPVLGGIIGVALWILVTILWIFSWVYAFSGEQKEVPLVGEFGRKIRL